MKILAWNCPGAAKPPFANYTKLLLRQHNLDILCFLETRLSENAGNHIRQFFGPAWDFYMILANGLLGGIVIVWKKFLGNVNFYNIDGQVAFGVITLNHGPSWILGVVYASTSVFQRRFLWSQVQDVLFLQIPLFLIGDFNSILNASGKKGGKPFTVNHDVREFRAFLRSIDLIDLGFSGPLILGVITPLVLLGSENGLTVDLLMING